MNTCIALASTFTRDNLKLALHVTLNPKHFGTLDYISGGFSDEIFF